MITNITKKAKDYITITTAKRNLEKIRELTPDSLSEFLYWFDNTQKSFDFFSNDNQIQVSNHRAVTDVSFYYLDRGVCGEVKIVDTDNSKIKKIFTFTITNIIKVKEVVTYSGFENGYNVRFYYLKVLDRSTYPTLFIVIKNLIKHSILKRLDFLLNGGEDIETIPDIFRQRI